MTVGIQRYKSAKSLTLFLFRLFGFGCQVSGVIDSSSETWTLKPETLSSNSYDKK